MTEVAPDSTPTTLDLIIVNPLEHRIQALGSLPFYEDALNNSELVGFINRVDFSEQRNGESCVMVRFVVALTTAGIRAVFERGEKTVTDHLLAVLRAAEPRFLPGVIQIMDERRRHIEEGYGPKHDDRHVRGEIAYAAAAFAAPRDPVTDQLYAASGWGAAHDQRRKNDRKKALRVAGSLCAAELDRLERSDELSRRMARSAASNFAPSFVQIKNAPKPPQA